MADSQRIKLSIVTPYREVLRREVDEVRAPGVWGEFGVLPSHTYFLSELSPGEVSYTLDGKNGHYAVSGGFAEVGPDRLTILADTAWEASEVDLARAAKEKESAEAVLAAGGTEEEHEEARAKLEFSVAQLNVVDRVKLK